MIYFFNGKAIRGKRNNKKKKEENLQISSEDHTQGNKSTTATVKEEKEN